MFRSVSSTAFRGTFILTALLVQTSAVFAETPAAVAARIGNQIVTSTVRHPATSISWGRAVVVVPAPLNSVMRTVQDYGRYHEFLPNFRTSRVLSRRGADATIYLEALILKGTITLWAQLGLRARPNEGDTRVIVGRLLQGNMKQFLARWELTPIDGSKTLVAFQILVAPDLPLPASVFTNENTKAARRTLNALRQRLSPFASEKKSS